MNTGKYGPEKAPYLDTFDAVLFNIYYTLITACTKQDHDEKLIENVFAAHYVKSGIELISLKKKVFKISHQVKADFTRFSFSKNDFFFMM